MNAVIEFKGSRSCNFEFHKSWQKKVLNDKNMENSVKMKRLEASKRTPVEQELRAWLFEAGKSFSSLLLRTRWRFFFLAISRLWSRATLSHVVYSSRRQPQSACATTDTLFIWATLLRLLKSYSHFQKSALAAEEGSEARAIMKDRGALVTERCWFALLP